MPQSAPTFDSPPLTPPPLPRRPPSPPPLRLAASETVRKKITQIRFHQNRGGAPARLRSCRLSENHWMDGRLMQSWLLCCTAADSGGASCLTRDLAWIKRLLIYITAHRLRVWSIFIFPVCLNSAFVDFRENLFFCLVENQCRVVFSQLFFNRALQPELLSFQL